MSTASMGLMRTIARTTGRVGAARLGRAAKSVGLAPSPAQALGHMGLSGRAGTASTFAVSAVRRKSTKPRLFEASSYRQKTTNAAAVEVAGGEHYALDPELGTEGEILELPKKVTPEEAFESLGLHRKVVKGLTSRGFTDLGPRRLDPRPLSEFAQPHLVLPAADSLHRRSSVAPNLKVIDQPRSVLD